jgi:hypothetical protein
MYYPLVRKALGVGLLVALVLTLSACGGGEEQAKPRPLSEDRKALAPGEYRSEEFIPSLSFQVGQGWSTNPPEVFDALLLTWGETVGLGLVNPQEVYKPTRSGSPEVVEAPDDLVGWFQQHPYLKTSNPKTVTVGGIEGVQFEVVVDNLPADYSGVCAGDCVDIFRSKGFGWIAFREDSKSRVIVLEDVNGETVTMGFTIPASQFDKLAPEAQKVIDSVEWRG